MRIHEAIAIGVFAFLALLAPFVPMQSRRRRLAAILASLVAIAAIYVVSRIGDPFRTWWPIVSILSVYWTGGQFFTQPMPAFEAALQAWDDRLLRRSGLLEAVGHAPRAVLEALELAYFTCFLVVPLGLAILLWKGYPGAADRYWTAVTISEFVAFAMVPWIQTRPPWAVESPGPIARRHLWMSRLTRALIERATIGINTFPSGHAAVSVAIALVVAGPLPVPGALLLALAVMIIAGAVLGRYHYTADVVAGTAVALAAWGIARLMP